MAKPEIHTPPRMGLSQIARSSPWVCTTRLSSPKSHGSNTRPRSGPNPESRKRCSPLSPNRGVILQPRQKRSAGLGSRPYRIHKAPIGAKQFARVTCHATSMARPRQMRPGLSGLFLECGAAFYPGLRTRRAGGSPWAVESVPFRASSQRNDPGRNRLRRNIGVDRFAFDFCHSHAALRTLPSTFHPVHRGLAARAVDQNGRLSAGPRRMVSTVNWLSSE